MNASHFFCLISFVFYHGLLDAQESPNNMQLIPGGSFMMGKNSHNETDYSPAHQVKVDSFYMDRNEVTNEQYLAFCTASGYHFPEFWNIEGFHCGDGFPNYPVIGINWMDASKYAAWAGKRLPTEAEWEYAARGGLKNKEFPNGYKWEKLRAKNKPGEWKNLTDNVGSFEANAFGLYDMGGNVWEWTSDGYDEGYYMISQMVNPKGPQGKTNRVIRGGSWHSGAMCKKVYYRKGLPLNWCDFAVGFRCAKDVD